MIKKITIKNKFEKILFSVDNPVLSKQEIALNLLFPNIDLDETHTFEIEFNQRIKRARTAAYQWTTDFKFYLAGPLSPKIIQLENEEFVQANCTHGFWEINPKTPKMLLWKINPDNSCVIAQYQGGKNYKILENCKSVNCDITLKLLFPKNEAIEWSRSKIPFSAVACFTDHCDFDTAKNLEVLRKLFKETGIITTKGFFLNHFSKREDNASWENDSAELKKWIEDGHELAYHSLSQSIKTDEESFLDFENFQSPLPNIPTWIDHGFQPYNLSLLAKNNRTKISFFKKMQSQKITVFWNYLDSGTSTSGVINQLNIEHFTLKTFFTGIRNLPFKEKIAIGIKNSCVHFYANEELIFHYKSLASRFKNVVKQKNVSALFGFIKSMLQVAHPLLKILFSWNSVKNKVYPLAKYNPVLFTIKENDSEFTIFQTLEMVDFMNSLSPKNLDNLCRENGLFVAHTYFSVPLDYHKGRVLLSEDAVNPKVYENFNYLGQLIKQKKVWNPTMAELNNYLLDVSKIEFSLDNDANCVFLTNTNYHFRAVL